MGIREQYSSRLVLEPARSNIVRWIVLSLAIFLFALAFSSGNIPLTVPAIFLLYFAGRLVSKRIVVDKLTKRITVADRLFMLIPRKHVLDFSEVNSISLGGGKTVGVGYSEGFYNEEVRNWKVLMFTGGKAVEIDHSTDMHEMMNLASELREFIGLESDTREPLLKTEFAGRIDAPSIEKSKVSKGPKCAHCGKPIIGLPFKLEGSGTDEYYCFRCKSKLD